MITLLAREHAGVGCPVAAARADPQPAVTTTARPARTAEMRRVTMSPSVPGLTPRRVRIGTLTLRGKPRFPPELAGHPAPSADSGDGPVGAGLEGALGQVEEHKRITERVGHLHYPADRDVLRPGKHRP